MLKNRLIYLQDRNLIISTELPLIDTIHSIKGGEANDVVIYEKSNWPAHLENKIGKEMD